MKGIILAGGTGTRLAPVTLGVSKQLVPVYDKPMIYYPLSTLMLAGIRDVLIITTPHDAASFSRLLGDGSQFGISISYATQAEPKGIAQAFIIGEEFIGNESVALVLGDNIFYGPKLGSTLARYQPLDGAVIFAHWLDDPRAYGVVEFDKQGKVISIEEKPENPRSHYAIPGLYFYSNSVIDVCHNLKPSPRGELEISDVNAHYMREEKLKVRVLSRGTAWFDTGTFEDLLGAGFYVRAVEERQGLRIGSPEEIAWRQGWITDEELAERAGPYLQSGYGDYLLRLIERGKDA